MSYFSHRRATAPQQELREQQLLQQLSVFLFSLAKVK
jgi:hypothetical protein